VSVGAPDLEVISVSFNVRGLLGACLRSLYSCAENEGLRLRVWVVDNASHDGSAEMVGESYPQAVLLRNEDNLGFARGCNRALERLGYSGPPEAPAPVLLLNPDTEVRPGALSLLLSDLTALPGAAVVGPGLCYGDGALRHSAFRFPGFWQTALEFFPINWRLLEGPLNGRYPRQERQPWPFVCDHPLGAAMLLRPEAIREVGLLDEEFFMYCEEIDWCLRAKRQGWEVWSDPRAVVVHHAGQSTTQVRREMYVELWRSRYRLFRKHRGVPYLAMMRQLVRLGMVRECFRAVREYRQGRMSGDYYRAHLWTCRMVAAL